MKVRIKTEYFIGTPKEIVRALFERAFTLEARPDLYRKAVAGRILLQKGLNIPANDDLTFLRGLARVGLAELEENGDS